MIDWVPEDQRDTAYPLFTEMFMVRIPYMQSMSVDHLRIFGVTHTGYGPVDNATVNEPLLRMMTIDDMSSYFKRNTSISVVNHADTKKIYDLISLHLNFWKTQLETEFHIKSAPLEDLALLDRLAAAVYPHAQQHFPTGAIDGLLARRLAGITSVTRDSILTRKPRTVANPIEEEPAPPTRASMAAIFASRQVAGKPKWK